MSNIEKCIKCEHYQSVYDGYGLCMKDAIGIMVVDDYEPTKNYNYCERGKTEMATAYGEMAYQKESKTAYQMQHEGWCDDCTEDVRKCIKQSRCEGYRRYHENIN